MTVSTVSTPRVGVITFPGSLDDGDALDAVSTMGGQGVPLWHGDDDLLGVDAVILPGGFSYGDYLRCGAIARFAPIMNEVRRFADRGGPVVGLMPHPGHAVDPDVGPTGGQPMFASLLERALAGAGA